MPRFLPFYTVPVSMILITSAVLSSGCKTVKKPESQSEVKSYVDSDGMICGDKPINGVAAAQTLNMAYRSVIMEILSEVPRFSNQMSNKNITSFDLKTGSPATFKIGINNQFYSGWLYSTEQPNYRLYQDQDKPTPLVSVLSEPVWLNSIVFELIDRSKTPVARVVVVDRTLQPLRLCLAPIDSPN